MKNTRTLLTVLAMAFTLSSHASIIAISDNFDTGITDNGIWTSVGSTTPKNIDWDETSTYDYYDNDDTAFLSYTNDGSMLITGDGLLNDGGLRLDTINGIAGDEAVGLTVGGTMDLNELITFSGNFYNDNTSYTDGNAQLWNLTDNVLLAETGNIRVKNYNNDSYAPVDFSVDYIAQASDVGDVLQIRFIDSGSTATARDVFVDNYTLTTAMVPEPATVGLFGLAGLVTFLLRRLRS